MLYDNGCLHPQDGPSMGCSSPDQSSCWTLCMCKAPHTGHEAICLPDPEATRWLAGKSQEAAATYCRAIEVCPDASKLWDSLSLLLTVLGRFEYADAAARHDPSALESVMIRA